MIGLQQSPGAGFVCCQCFCCLAGISHPDAGDGLWLQGTAPVGAVVGLYPGLVYEPMHYR